MVYINRILFEYLNYVVLYRTINLCRFMSNHIPQDSSNEDEISKNQCSSSAAATDSFETKITSSAVSKFEDNDKTSISNEKISIIVDVQKESAKNTCDINGIKTIDAMENSSVLKAQVYILILNYSANFI